VPELQGARRPVVEVLPRALPGGDRFRARPDARGARVFGVNRPLAPSHSPVEDPLRAGTYPWAVCVWVRDGVTGALLPARELDPNPAPMPPDNSVSVNEAGHPVVIHF
jgi:hypothetical protein